MRVQLFLKSTIAKPLTFGAVFIKEKLVPKRIELLNILHKIQVVELVLLS